MNFYPKGYFKNVSEISIDYLKQHHIKGLILDVDNTLIDYYKHMTDETVQWIQKLKENDYWVIASDHHAEHNHYEVDYTNMNFALIMGAEHAGISKSLLKLSDFKVKIPMLTNFNSLNVSNATAIILFEAVRQKLNTKTKR